MKAFFKRLTESVFIRYLFLFLLLFLSLASLALYLVISTESNPFFYANF